MTKEESPKRPANIVLDELEFEDKPPFVAVIKGRQIEFRDPQTIDYRILATLDEDNPLEFIAETIRTHEDSDWVMDQEIEGRRMEKLIEGYMAYYDLTGGRGKGRASRRQ